MMNGVNHASNEFLSFPFRALGNEWQKMSLTPDCKRNIIIGNAKTIAKGR